MLYTSSGQKNETHWKNGEQNSLIIMPTPFLLMSSLWLI